MTPATRARLCAALERETGRPWISRPGETRIIYCPSRMGRLIRRDDGRVNVVVNLPRRTGADINPLTGPGWPERLAAEVARVLSETSTTGEKP